MVFTKITKKLSSSEILLASCISFSIFVLSIVFKSAMAIYYFKLVWIIISIIIAFQYILKRKYEKRSF